MHSDILDVYLDGPWMGGGWVGGCTDISDDIITGQSIRYIIRSPSKRRTHYNRVSMGMVYTLGRCSTAFLNVRCVLRGRIKQTEQPEVTVISLICD